MVHIRISSKSRTKFPHERFPQIVEATFTVIFTRTNGSCDDSGSEEDADEYKPKRNKSLPLRDLVRIKVKTLYGDKCIVHTEEMPETAMDIQETEGAEERVLWFVVLSAEKGKEGFAEAKLATRLRTMIFGSSAKVDGPVMSIPWQ